MARVYHNHFADIRPTVKKAVKYAGDGSNAKAVLEKDNLTVFYSYTTPIAFVRDGQLVKTKQKYSASTSRHMNCITGEGKLLDNDEFCQELVNARRG